MKLIIENWRQYLVESEQVSRCGDLYLFEGDTVTKTSFYDALNTLSESDNDVDTFLENWERSVDYMFENLDEAMPIETGVSSVDNAILKVSTQAWMLQNKLKEKAAGKVLAVSKKINDFAEKNPKTVKVAKVVVGGLLAAAAVYGISQILQSGGDASDVMELAQSIQPEDPSLAQDLAECAQEFNPQKVAEFAQEQQEVVEKVADTLSTAGEPALDQVGQAADSVAQDMPDDFDWNEAFMDAADETSQASGGEEVADLMQTSSPDDIYNKYGPYGEQVWNSSMNPDEKSELLQKFAEDWEQFNNIVDTLENGGTLEDVGMTRKEFRKWASDSVQAPMRGDTALKTYGRGIKAILNNPLDASIEMPGRGGIPPRLMKKLRFLVRASLK